MSSAWKGKGAATLIGSVPYRDHRKAIEKALSATPEIPVWPQLSPFPKEGMMVQFSEGFPGLRHSTGQGIVDTGDPAFEGEVLRFYEDYLKAEENGDPLKVPRFALGPETGKAFFLFVEALRHGHRPIGQAVKGQIVGPFTFLSGTRDENGKPILYDDRLRDIGVKLLAMKARWQVETLRALGTPILLFIDEPALAGFGSSTFLGVSAGMVQELVGEVAEAIHSGGGIAGIHVCGNTDWSLVLRSNVEIVNFDAHGYFDRFLLYREEAIRFVEQGKTLAWGLVPTSDPVLLHSETEERLWLLWQDRIHALFKGRFPISEIVERSLVTPSCGCGTLNEEDVERVFSMTLELSRRIRSLGEA